MRTSLLSALVVLTAACAVPTSAAAAAAPPPCSAAPVSGTSEVSLTSGGLERSSVVHVPPGLGAGQAAPLLLALHGAYGDGPGMESYSDFDELADRDGFIVAYPSAAGTHNFWNISEAANQPDDVGFIGALITQLETSLCIDSSRVFAAGVSNGGGMVALLGCALSSTLAGVAAVAGAYNTLPACHSRHPISLLEIHGTADRVAPYFGRRGARATANGLPPFVSTWAGHDGCAKVPAKRRIATRTTAFVWGRCKAGTTVEHIQIIGGTHQWPGAMPPDPGPPSTFWASSVIWSFFKKLPPVPTPSAPTQPPPPTSGGPSPQPSGGATL